LLEVMRCSGEVLTLLRLPAPRQPCSLHCSLVYTCNQDVDQYIRNDGNHQTDDAYNHFIIPCEILTHRVRSQRMPLAQSSPRTYLLLRTASSAVLYLPCSASPLQVDFLHLYQPQARHNILLYNLQLPTVHIPLGAPGSAVFTSS
jgi:hypothetical protein